jgi:hypothetical protein
MTLDEWLETRDPPPPTALAERLRVLLAGRAREDVARTPDVYLDAAEEVLASLLREGCTSRDSALDLLAVDALVTYAFEAAAADPASLDERAGRAMARISAVATVPGA